MSQAQGEAIAWAAPVRLAEVDRAPVDLTLTADAAARASIARVLDLVAVDSLTASVRVAAWLDGAEVSGDWRAVIVQTCGVSLESFDTALDGAFTVHVVPPGSVHAPGPAAELVIDLEAEDPPDVLEGHTVDVAAYVVEHLALEIDPFPRKPGAAFEAPAAEAAPTPFAALARLRGDPPA